MSGLALFTAFHVFLSLAGILTGLVMAYGLLTARAFPRWTIAFLVTTAATLLTGFLFPFHGITPAIGVGIITTVILVLAVVARYAFRLRWFWREVYIVGAFSALYLNCFVLVVQAFQKVPALHALAPDGAGPTFRAAQAIVFLFFVVLGYQAVRSPRLKAA
jgi:hypothetical protein